MDTKESAKKAWLTTLLLVLSVGILFTYQSCSHKEIDVNAQLQELLEADTLHLSAIDVGHAWDTLWVLKPYDGVDQLPLQMKQADRKAVAHLALSDGQCTLLFAHRGELVGYAAVSRRLLDFGPLCLGRYARLTPLLLRDGKAYDIE